MRRLGDSTLSPPPLPGRDTVFLSGGPVLSLSATVVSLPPGTHPFSARANYTCANQPTSNEARPVALSVERVEPLLSSAHGGWVERGPGHGVCREAHFA